MSETMTLPEQGFPDRKEYWSKKIDGKTVSEIAEIIADYEKRATRDELTGLLNKSEFGNQFKALSEAAIRRQSSLYVIYFDFDDLKYVNDTKGHGAGNELLQTGCEILKSSLRTSDLLGRIGGDEFAAALEIDKAVGDKTFQIEEIAQRVISELEDSGISISLGLSEYKEGESLNDALDKAERNMKLDKTDRRVGRDFIKEKQNA